MKKNKKSASSKAEKSPNSSRRKIMGADIKNIGAAIAMAVVGEIAQTAMNRVVKGAKQSDQPEKVSASLQNAVGSTRSSIENGVPLKGASAVVQQVLAEVQPAIAELVEAVIGTTNATEHAAASVVEQSVTGLQDVAGATGQTVGDFVQDSIGAVKQAPGAVAQSVQDSLQNGAAAVADVVKAVVNQSQNPERKGKKKKKKKKDKDRK